MVDICCNMICTFVSGYFERSVNDTIKSHILKHLLTCNDCRKKYEMYANKNKKAFDLKEECITLLKSGNMPDRNREMLRDTFQKEYPNVDISDCRIHFSYLARTNNLESLKKIKSVGDMLEERLEFSDEILIARVAEFGKYLAKKMCEELDMLENCYAKDVKIGVPKDEIV